MKTLQYLFQETQINFLLNGTDQNVMINATEMAKAFGKRIDHFLETKSTKDFISALEFTAFTVNSINNSSPEFSQYDKNSKSKRPLETIISTHGQNGTLFCEELALKFAAWLSPEFEVWVYSQIKEITFGNYARHWDAHARAEAIKLDIAKLKEDFLNNGASKEEMALYFDKEKSLKEATKEKTAAIRNQLNLFKD